MTDTVMMLMCVCKQAAIKTADMLWCDPVSLSLSHTHTHTQAVIKIADMLWCDPVSLTHTHTSRD